MEAISGEVMARSRMLGTQELANIAWSFAKLQILHYPLLTSLSEAARHRLQNFRAQELANISWAWSALAVEHHPLMASIASAARPKISAFNTLELANTVWAFSTLGMCDQPLLAALSAAAMRKLQMPDKGQGVQESRTAVSLLGALSVLSDLGLLPSALARSARKSLTSYGDYLDRIASVTAPACVHVRPVTHTYVACNETIPHVALELGYLLVIHKPANWEVDTQDHGSARRLSLYLQAALPESTCPIAHDQFHNFGILHRLDTPGSGLILVAKTFSTYYDLRWQLATGAVERDYVSLWHGWVPAELSQITVPVRYAREDGQVPSVADTESKRVAITWIKVLAHTIRGSQPFTLLALRIGTGRRHQIRTHAAHAGHPTVCDALYAPQAAPHDRTWCSRNFLHRYRLAFEDSEGRSREVISQLPTDLLQALAELSPRPGDLKSAASLSEWLSGQGARDWSLYERATCMGDRDDDIV
eukprot:gnl/TRDRNA2_/TRDRNA2_167577_c4_seq2.p1 gnl/TRDRNA2_/TRDRNA2_167577_c4~~gnl/TRDRNA2_/TRDRNA2_167577_c4_seq2.p1  ORF type:complete len:476 (+),score=33.92 gnl/TRDRNA2_/TRDRNA2_167577_c4_seq2:116-1543(+)